MKAEVENKNNNSKISLIIAGIAVTLAIASLIVAILALTSRGSSEVARKIDMKFTTVLLCCRMALITAKL